MAASWISWVPPENLEENQKIDQLLAREGIRRDGNLDYTCGLYDEAGRLLATGSCFGNTLRCLAVDSAHQGEGLMNQVVSQLLEVQCQRGNTHVFLYTKCAAAKFFGGLGFYEIARVESQNIVFMENRRGGFAAYRQALAAESPPVVPSAALVMNANPFTYGHQYLVERAAAENQRVHLFVVSEDVSAFPFAVRRRLVREGTAHLPGVICHDSGPYIISSATFPSYFQKDALSVAEGHARLDLTVFGQLAAVLGIQRRYVGEEPQSEVTNLYNRVMAEELPLLGIACTVLPRKEVDGRVISASTVRAALREENWEILPSLVPPATLAYLQSAAAAPILQALKAR